MALFGSSRDASLFRHINRELLPNIVTQQISFYKVNLEKTTSNLYGESVGKRYFAEPVLLNCLIKRTDPNFEATELGRDYNRVNTFSFLKDDLVDAGVFPELGDIIMYYEGYYEIEQSFDNQLVVGKDPDYPYNSNNELNPLNPNLEEFGYSVSINCIAHYVSADKLSITRER